MKLTIGLNPQSINLILTYYLFHYCYFATSKSNLTMYHVCIFTDYNNEKFIPVGGYSESEIQKALAEIVKAKFTNRQFSKLVIFKSFMMDEEGEIYLTYISKLEQKDLSKLVSSENVTFSDQLKHLVNQ